jgi:putative solute:sodium symporter small subunit
MADSGASREEHWARTSRLTVITLILWFIFSFGVHWFAPDLNKIVILGFPLGFYMAGQGSLIAFVVIIFWGAVTQNRIDEETGMAEEPED